MSVRAFAGGILNSHAPTFLVHHTLAYYIAKNGGAVENSVAPASDPLFSPNVRPLSPIGAHSWASDRFFNRLTPSESGKPVNRGNFSW